MWSALTSLFGVTPPCVPPSFFGLKPWYQYLKTDGDCNVVDFQILYRDANGAGRSDVLLVGLALIDDMLRIAGFVAIGFIIYGGIVYLTSQGSPDATGKAQSTIQNALIGLVVCILAIALVTFLGSRVAV